MTNYSSMFNRHGRKKIPIILTITVSRLVRIEHAYLGFCLIETVILGTVTFSFGHSQGGSTRTQVVRVERKEFSTSAAVKPCRRPRATPGGHWPNGEMRTRFSVPPMFVAPPLALLGIKLFHPAHLPENPSAHQYASQPGQQSGACRSGVSGPPLVGLRGKVVADGRAGQTQRCVLAETLASLSRAEMLLLPDLLPLPRCRRVRPRGRSSMQGRPRRKDLIARSTQGHRSSARRQLLRQRGRWGPLVHQPGRFIGGIRRRCFGCAGVVAVAADRSSCWRPSGRELLGQSPQPAWPIAFSLLLFFAVWILLIDPVRA